MNARTPLRRSLAVLAAALASLTLTVASGGVTRAATPDPTISPAWPAGRTLTYAWTAGAVPPSVMKNAVNAAAADATSTRASRAPAFSYSASASNGVSYGTSNPCGVNGLACFQRNPSSSYWHLWFRENGHRYDWGTLSWCEMSGSPNGCYQAETITLDELGHVDGLDHHQNLANDSDYTDAVVQTYSHAKAQAGWNAKVFGRCDVATLQQVYDVASTATRYSTCLDVPTTLSIGAAPTTATTGTTVAFTATLRSAGSGQLAGNLMAGRTVVLQVRSGTTWADVATMAAGASAGTYTGSYTPRATLDFRAVFRKPAAEGVRASTSGTITIAFACTRAPCPVAVMAASAFEEGTGPWSVGVGLFRQ